LLSTRLQEFLVEFIYQSTYQTLESFTNRLAGMPDSKFLDRKDTALSYLTSANARKVWTEFCKLHSQDLESVSIRDLVMALSLGLKTKKKFYENPAVEVVWSGPNPGEYPFRSTERAYLEVIQSSQNDLYLVSFAVYHLKSIKEELQKAIDRKVKIHIIAESKEKVQTDVWKQIGISGKLVNYYYWPKEKRKSQNNSYASLHAKTAISDQDIAFVTSANLTEYAMKENMELGVMIRGGDVPRSLREHFKKLIESSELVRC
jgi:cardiolipin synthase A/B